MEKIKLNSEYKKYLLHYFAVLKTELESLKQSGEMLNEIKESNIENISLEIIFKLESYIIQNMSFEQLESKVWHLRKEFRKYALPTSYQDYLDSSLIKPNTDLKTIEEKDLRADLLSLLTATQMAQISFIAREHSRNEIAKYTLYFLLLISILWLIVFGIFNTLRICDYGINESSLILWVSLFGFMGGVISSLGRLNQSSEEYIPAKTDSEKVFSIDATLFRLFMGVFMAALSGLVFAIILFFTIKGNLLKIIFSDKILSNNNNEFSVLVWSFIAGFCEKFVPDSLFFIVSRRLSK